MQSLTSSQSLSFPPVGGIYQIPSTVTADIALSVGSAAGFNGPPPSLTIANNSAYRCILTPRAGTINGAATYTVAPGQVVTFTSDGSTNLVVSAASGPSFGMQWAYAKYDFAVDGGVVGAITPVQTSVIPDNAIMVCGSVNVTTAALSGGAMSISIGTTAGSSASALLAATAKASLTIDALINAVPVFATPVKMTAAGSINFTIISNAATAGVIEVWIGYLQAAA